MTRKEENIAAAAKRKQDRKIREDLLPAGQLCTGTIWFTLIAGEEFLRVSCLKEAEWIEFPGGRYRDVGLSNIQGLLSLIYALTCRYNYMVERMNGMAADTQVVQVSKVELDV